MGCTKALDFVTPVTGAHLSFYWTMDEPGAANKLDSTVALPWPLKFGSTASPGLFSNGTHLIPAAVLNQRPGLGMFSNTSVVINQATSTGVSWWFWVKLSAYGGCVYQMDTSDPLHTNQLRFGIAIFDALNGFIGLDHTNDTDNATLSTPNLTWALGVWHMVVGTYNKTAQTINIYIDGVLSASTADAFVYPNLTSTDMTLDDSDLTTGFDGVVDEFGLCLGGALTQTQITSLYNGGSGVTWPNITPIVPYP